MAQGRSDCGAGASQGPFIWGPAALVGWYRANREWASDIVTA